MDSKQIVEQKSEIIVLVKWSERTDRFAHGTDSEVSGAARDQVA